MSLVALHLPMSLRCLNDAMRGKPGLYALTRASRFNGREVVAVAASATDLSPMGMCPSLDPEIVYVGEMTANVPD